MKDKIPWKKLGKYISGECSQREFDEIDAWVLKEWGRREIVNSMKKVWDYSEIDKTYNIDLAWHKIIKKMNKKGFEDHL